MSCSIFYVPFLHYYLRTISKVIVCPMVGLDACGAGEEADLNKSRLTFAKRTLLVEIITFHIKLMRITIESVPCHLLK